MMRERSSFGKRSQPTKICAAWSSVSFLRESAPFGSTLTFHVHSRIGVSFRLTLPLTSFAIVDPSSLLLSRRALRPPPSTIVKSYVGVPHCCFSQPAGTPCAPRGCEDQSSITTELAAHAETESSVTAPRIESRSPRMISWPLRRRARRHQRLPI